MSFENAGQSDSGIIFSQYNIFQKKICRIEDHEFRDYR